MKYKITQNYIIRFLYDIIQYEPFFRKRERYMIYYNIYNIVGYKIKNFYY